MCVSVIGLENKKNMLNLLLVCLYHKKIKVKEAQVKWYLKESSSPLSSERDDARIKEVNAKC